MAVTNFIWDALSDNVLLETDENDATVVAYTHKPNLFGKLLSQDRAAATSVYHYDCEYSTRQLTDENQSITDTYVYSAFGENVSKTGTTENPFQYNGAVGYYTNSETDDLYVRARTYEPALGRWYSKDPLKFVDEPNLYSYVQNQPITFVDPTGEFTQDKNEIPSTGTALDVDFNVVRTNPKDKCPDPCAAAKNPVNVRVKSNHPDYYNPESIYRSPEVLHDFRPQGLVELIKTQVNRPFDCIASLHFVTHGSGEGFTIGYGKGCKTIIDSTNAKHWFAILNLNFCFCKPCQILLNACWSGDDKKFLKIIHDATGCTVYGPTGKLIGWLDPADPLSASKGRVKGPNEEPGGGKVNQYPEMKKPKQGIEND